MPEIDSIGAWSESESSFPSPDKRITSRAGSAFVKDIIVNYEMIMYFEAASLGHEIRGEVEEGRELCLKGAAMEGAAT